MRAENRKFELTELSPFSDAGATARCSAPAAARRCRPQESSKQYITNSPGKAHPEPWTGVVRPP
eukprot:9470969-Pyramimonas_sp.AAC.1